MRLEYQILIAVGLDLVLGDPRWLPHPVRGIAWLASGLERTSHRLIPWAALAGVTTAAAVYVAVGLAAWGLIRVAAVAHAVAADVVSVGLIYVAIATRDLAARAMAVYRPLAAGNLEEARRQVGKIVGRDTERLDEPGVVRAAVESVAENTVDAVTAPLFWAIVAGPVGAIAYRAVNTLDSLFGYKNERYLEFGRAPARVDDLAAFLPARMTAPLFALSAVFLGGRPWRSLKTMLRDGRKHASPNAGLSEAAVAGALGIQLRGLSYYGGTPLKAEPIGEPIVAVSPGHVRQAVVLMLVASAWFLALGLALRALVLLALSP